ncbi:hypothetical protein [Halobaculum sp. MBLA0143]|uniref:DUF7535 family protein n=1 Tax=Halobaculum sp. MBLA0143 TaxID=3079933 RepID=UPI003525529B
MSAPGTSRTDGTLPSAETVLDTVTPPYVGRPNAETDAVGPTYVLGMVIVSVPFLPLLALVWPTRRVLSASGPRGGE